MIEAAADVYKKTPNEKIVGCYMLQRPILLVRDMEIVKNILVKDFSNFHDRGMEIDLKREPLAGMPKCTRRTDYTRKTYYQ